MANLLNFDEFLKINENSTSLVQQDPDWKEGGIVLIKGKVLKDGYPRLYSARLKKLWSNPRGGFMVNLDPKIYVIVKSGSGYEARKIDPTQKILATAVGIESYNVVLNSKSGKTPLWRKSVNEIHFPKFLKDWETVIDTWEEFKF